MNSNEIDLLQPWSPGSLILLEENEKVSTEASLKEMDTLLELNITEIDRIAGFIRSLEGDLNGEGFSPFQQVNSGSAEYAESDDGISFEVEQINNITASTGTEMDLLNSGETATFIIVPKHTHSEVLASAEKEDKMNTFTLLQTPNNRSCDEQRELSSKVELLLEVISERRIKARLEALASSPWSSSLSDGEDTDPNYFVALAGASAAVFGGAASVDDSAKDFFSAFPNQRDSTQIKSPSPSSSGKKLHDIMSSSSSDFTVDKLRLNWELEDDIEESNEYQKALHFEAVDADPSEGSAPDPSSIAPSPPKPLVQPQESLESNIQSWSSGARLSAAGMKRCYVGLFSSPRTLDNFNGTLMRLEMANAKDSNTSAILDSFFAAGAKSKVDYYCVHVVEIAVRPDVELKSLMASVSAILRTQTGTGSSWKPSGLRYSYIQRSHGLVSRLPLSDNRISSPAAVPVSASEPEWDLVDVQVCLSKKQRRRVLLFQFLKSFPSTFDSVGLNKAIGGFLFSQSGTATVPMKRLEDSKKVKKFLGLITADLASNELLFSCLNTVSLQSVCALQNSGGESPLSPSTRITNSNAPLSTENNKSSSREKSASSLVSSGLDAHFVAQLHSLCREQMLENINVEYSAMESYLRQEEEDCESFIKTLEPIFKQYSLKMPSFTEGKKIFMIVQEIKKHQRKAIAPEGIAEKLSSSLEKISGSAAVLDASQAGAEEIAVDADRPIDQDIVNRSRTSTGSPESARRRSTSVYETELSGQSSVNGMTFCLIMLDNCFKELQTSCDQQSEERIQRKNSTIVRHVQDMHDYKETLLSFVAHSKIALNSQFVKTFLAQFADAPIREDFLINSNTSSKNPPESIRRERSMTTVAATVGDEKNNRARSNSTVSFMSFGKSLLGVSTSSTSSQLPAAADEGGSALGEPTGPSMSSEHVQSFERVVLHYCRCTLTISQEGDEGRSSSSFISWSTGTVYITISFICITMSTLGLGLHPRKEVFRLKDIKRCELVEVASSFLLTTSPSKSSGGQHSSSSSSKSLEIKFFSSPTVLTIRPLLVDSAHLRSVITVAKDHKDSPAWAMVGT